MFLSISGYHNVFAGPEPGPGLGSISGTVTDKNDGKPISGATISIPT